MKLSLTITMMPACSGTHALQNSKSNVSNVLHTGTFLSYRDQDSSGHTPREACDPQSLIQHSPTELRLCYVRLDREGDRTGSWFYRELFKSTVLQVRPEQRESKLGILCSWHPTLRVHFGLVPDILTLLHRSFSANSFTKTR